MYLVFLNELFLGENRYKPFKDKTMSCMRGRKGSNQNDELYLGENVHPFCCIESQNRALLGKSMIHGETEEKSPYI